jgi:hypothetical protein
MNPLVLALIGLPLFLGIVIRFAYFKREILAMNMALTSAVLIIIWIGYAFMTFASPNRFLLENGIYLCILGTVLLPAFIFTGVKLEDPGVEVGCGVFLLYMFPLVVLVSIGAAVQAEHALAAAAAFVLLLLIGCLNSLLGSIAAGFSISAAVHSFVTTGTFHYISIWKDIFELMDIESTPMKLVVLGVVIVAGSAEPLSDLAE